MTGNLKLTSSPEPITLDRGGRLRDEDKKTTLALPTERSRRPGTPADGSTSRASRRPKRTDSLWATPEIALDQLHTGDQILIRTVNSTYIFLVTDPAKRLGLLVGGVFGNYAAHAVLDVWPVEPDQRLRAGARARFQVESSAGIKRVISSVITGLTHRRTGTEPR
jgi:hypothetical protein